MLCIPVSSSGRWPLSTDLLSLNMVSWWMDFSYSEPWSHKKTELKLCACVCVLTHVCTYFNSNATSPHWQKRAFMFLFWEKWTKKKKAQGDQVVLNEFWGKCYVFFHVWKTCNVQVQLGGKWSDGWPVFCCSRWKSWMLFYSPILCKDVTKSWVPRENKSHFQHVLCKEKARIKLIWVKRQTPLERLISFFFFF